MNSLCYMKCFSVQLAALVLATSLVRGGDLSPAGCHPTPACDAAGIGLPCAEGEAPEEPPKTPRPTRPTGPARMRLNPPAAPKLGEPINDFALGAYLEREATALVEKGLTLTNWPDLKERKSAQLKLLRPGTKARPRTSIAAQMERSVAVIGVSFKCGRCNRLHLKTATGFFISEDGALATCWHVLGGSDEENLGVVAMTRDGRVLPIKGILASDQFNDLLVLQVEGSKFSALPIGASTQVGEPVSILSHPERHFFMLTEGQVAREIAENRRGGVLEQVCVTAEFAKGSSGAPVVDETGAVVGVVNNTQSIYYNVVKEDQRDFQMTIRNCTPGRVLQRLCTPAVARK